jgi:glycosyltransferase involved in cell wall biosynthesis
METKKFIMVSTHYPPYHLGGDAVFVRHLGTELARIGHEVHIFYSPDVYRLLRNRDEKNPVEDPPGLSRHEYSYRFRRIGPVSSLAFGTLPDTKAALRRLVDEIRPDVVHWHNTRGFIGQPLPTPGSMSLFTAHDYYPVCPRGNLLRPGSKICPRPYLCQICLMRWKKPPQLWRIGGKRPLRFPKDSTILAPSEFMSKRLSVDGIVSNHVLRNFSGDMGGLITAREEPRILLFVGLMESFKGPHTLIEAFIKSSKDHGFSLWMVGEGSLREGISKRVKEAGLENRVKLPGYVQMAELKDALKATAAMMVPSEAFENQPTVALEAFSMGIPVIGSDIGGIPEIVGPASGSMVFPPGDAAKLAEMITSFWTRRSELPELRRLARKAYSDRFSPEANIRQYLGIIDSQKR